MTEHDWYVPLRSVRRPKLFQSADVTAQCCRKCGAWRGRGPVGQWVEPDARTCEEQEMLEVHES